MNRPSSRSGAVAGAASGSSGESKLSRHHERCFGPQPVVPGSSLARFTRYDSKVGLSVSDGLPALLAPKALVEGGASSFRDGAYTRRHSGPSLRRRWVRCHPSLPFDEGDRTTSASRRSFVDTNASRSDRARLVSPYGVWVPKPLNSGERSDEDGRRIPSLLCSLSASRRTVVLAEEGELATCTTVNRDNDMWL